MPDGLTGRQKSCPASKAAATGEQPAPWAPLNTGTVPSSTRPTSIHSSKPRAIFVNSDPDAIGTTSRSGRRKLSCSTIS